MLGDAFMPKGSLLNLNSVILFFVAGRVTATKSGKDLYVSVPTLSA